MSEPCWYEGLDGVQFLGLCPTEDGSAGYEGFVATLDDAFQIIQAFQNLTDAHFVVVKQKKSALEFDKHKIFWEEPKKNICKGPILQYDGVPFVIRSSTTLECQFGRDRHIARKRRVGKEFSPGTANANRTSRKQDCRASICIREICRFPQFRIAQDTPKRRFHQAKKLRLAMNNPSAVVTETRIYVRLPREETHSNHPVGEAALTRPVNAQVKAFVRQQISAGVHTVSALQQVTEKYVEHELFNGKPLPLRHDRRFFPGRRYFTNMLYRTRHTSSGALQDEKLEIVDAEWEPGTTFVEVEAGGTVVLIDAGTIQLESCPSPMSDSKVMLSTAARCREVLNQLVDLTYRCTDVAHLEALEQRLRFAHLEFLAGSQGDAETMLQVPLVARWESVEQSVSPPQKRIRVTNKMVSNV